MTMSLLLWLGAHLFLHNLWIFLTVFLTKGLIIFGLAYAATKLFPYLPAEHKHTIWLLIILGFVLLPVGRLFVHVLPITFPDPNEATAVSRLAAIPIAYNEKVISLIDATRPNAAGAAGIPVGRMLLLLPVGLWLLGAAFFVLRNGGARIALRRLAVCPAALPSHRFVFAELVQRMRIPREVSLVCSARCAIPMTYGWLHPKIVLPTISYTWPDKQLRAVLIHELTHVKRADYLSNAVVYLVCAFQWFNPFVWLAREFMLSEAEISCDRSVLTSGMQGTEYASAIVDIVRAARGHLLFRGAYGIIGRKSLLRERILRLLTLDSGLRSSALVRTGKALLFCFSLLVALFAITYSLKASERLYGTWIERGIAGTTTNGDGERPDYKFNWSDDGRGLKYDSCMPDLPISKGEFVIEKKWSDLQGNTWYNLKTKWISRTIPVYALIRIEKSGKICEYDASYSGYPSKFSGPIGAANHEIYVRQ